MIDSFSISFEFGDSRIYVTKKELESLPESVETLYDELITRAKEVSPFYAKCLQDFLDVSEGSVRAFFSESTRKRIEKFCKKEQDDDFFNLYESLYQYVRIPHDISVDVKNINAEKLISIFGENFPPEDIKELQSKSKEIGHFPLFLAFDKFFRNCEPLVRDYALTISYIYLSPVKRNRKPVDGLEEHEATAFNKLVNRIGKLSKHINRLFKDVEKTYKSLRFWEINEIEGTNFSQSFIYWILWKYADVWFLGEYASGFPKWCFSHDSVEICYPPRNLTKEPFDNLYNYIADQLASLRKENIKVPVTEFLQYKDPPDGAKIVHNKKTGEDTIEEVPGKIIKVNPSKSVMDEVKRLIRFIGHDLLINGKDLVIPAGEIVLIPREKREGPSRIEIIKEQYKQQIKERIERKLRDKEIVESCPLVERYIKWTKVQEWYDVWAILIKHFYEIEPEEYLHTYSVFKALNNSTPTGCHTHIMHPCDDKIEEEMPYDVKNFFSSLADKAGDFINEDRRKVVREIEDEIESSKEGYLIKTPEEILERFGLDPKRVEYGASVLDASLRSRRMEFAPINYKNHICIYRPKSLIYDSTSILRWQERYGPQYSFIRIAAQMVRMTKLNESDIITIKNFLAKTKMDEKVKTYFFACFIAFTIDGPGSAPYRFSDLPKNIKSEYLNELTDYTQGFLERVKILEKHRHRFD